MVIPWKKFLKCRIIKSKKYYCTVINIHHFYHSAQEVTKVLLCIIGNKCIRLGTDKWWLIFKISSSYVVTFFLIFSQQNYFPKIVSSYQLFWRKNFPQRFLLLFCFQCLIIHIVDPILQSLQESPLDKNKRGATVGMFLLVLHHDNHVPMSHLVMQLLCRFMLLFPDCEKKTCPDLEDLEKNFPQLMKNNKKFVNQIKCNEKLASLIKDKITFGSLR